MKQLSNQELLDVWERGTGHHPIQQALLLLTAACPELSPEAIAELSLGQRDSYLLTLREWLFGSRLTSRAVCPDCGEQVELTFDTADIRVASETDSTEALSITTKDYEVRFRLPNSLDLISVATLEQPTERHLALLERCLITAIGEGDSPDTAQLPVQVVDAVIDKMAQVDPQADVHLTLTCPTCAHEWTMAFDIITYLWDEINHWAYRILHQVHVLASAYGWHETDIVAMSQWKRQFYLQLVNE